MITITNGSNTFQVTEGAFKDIFKAQGFYETTVETSSASQGEQEGSGVKLPEPTPENVSRDVSDEETDYPATTETPEVKNTDPEPEVDLSEIPLSEMTNNQLREYANQLGVDLKGITSRKAVINKLKSAL